MEKRRIMGEGADMHMRVDNSRINGEIMALTFPAMAICEPLKATSLHFDSISSSMVRSELTESREADSLMSAASLPSWVLERTPLLQRTKKTSPCKQNPVGASFDLGLGTALVPRGTTPSVGV